MVRCGKVKEVKQRGLNEMDYIQVTVIKKTIISKEQLPALGALQNKRELFAGKNEKLLAKLEKLAEKSKDCEIEFEFNDDVW